MNFFYILQTQLVSCFALFFFEEKFALLIIILLGLINWQGYIEFDHEDVNVFKYKERFWTIKPLLINLLNTNKRAINLFTIIGYCHL